MKTFTSNPFGSPRRALRAFGRLLRFGGENAAIFAKSLPLAAALTILPSADALSAPAAGDALNSEPTLARLFTQLTHGVERGVPRPHLVRYERPVSVSLEGPGAERYERFVADYAGRLRRNSGVDIALGRGAPNLHVRFVGRGFSSVAPGVACLVAPGDVRWAELAANPRRYDVRATARMTRIDHMTVFVPASTSKRRTESCLIEEIAQALGPANDLTTFGDTIFNDDDVHTWPTAFDYLMLRVLYSDDMRTGMSRAESEQAALGVLEQVADAGDAAETIAAVGATLPRGTARPSARVRRPDGQSSFATAGAER